MTTLTGTLTHCRRLTRSGTLLTATGPVSFTLAAGAPHRWLTDGLLVSLAGDLHGHRLVNARRVRQGGSKRDFAASLTDGLPLGGRSGRPERLLPRPLGQRLADAFLASSLTVSDLLERPLTTLVTLGRLATPRANASERIHIQKAARRFKRSLGDAEFLEFLGYYQAAVASIKRDGGDPYALYWSLVRAHRHGRIPTSSSAHSRPIIDLLRADPWLIYRVPYLPEMPTDLAIGDALASELGWNPASRAYQHERERAAIRAAAWSIPRNGGDGGPALDANGRASLLLNKAAALLGIDPAVPAVLARLEIRLAETNDKAFSPVDTSRDTLQRVGGHYQISPIAFNEARAADLVADRLFRPNVPGPGLRVSGTAIVLPNGSSRDLRRLGLHDPQTSHEQARAVVTALTSRFFVLTGDPGCGKSHTLAAVARVALAMGRTVAACATTGKAAQRLADGLRAAGVTNVPVQTVHRLAHLAPDRPPMVSREKAGAAWTVDADVVLVDEASMLDIVTFGVLCLHTAATTSLVLAGDPRQLCAVGPGQVLADLLDYLPPTLAKRGIVSPYHVRHSHLQHNWRPIGSGGHAIAALAKSLWPPQQPPVWDPAAMPNGVAYVDATSMSMPTFCARVLRAFRTSGGAAVVLTPLIKTAETLAPLLRQAMLGTAAARASYAVGDRVIQLVNTEMLANGNLGVVKEVVPGDHGTIAMIRVVFDNGVTAWCAVTADVADLPEPDTGTPSFARQPALYLDYAYVLTVHKGQGSEYPKTIIAIAPRTGAQLTRAFWNTNLAYTAISRARSGLTIIAPMAAMEFAVAHPAARRISQFPYRIAKRIAEATAGISPALPASPRGPRPPRRPTHVRVVHTQRAASRARAGARP